MNETTQGIPEGVKRCPECGDWLGFDPFCETCHQERLKQECRRNAEKERRRKMLIGLMRSGGLR